MLRNAVQATFVGHVLFSPNSNGVGADAGAPLIARTPLALRLNVPHQPLPSYSARRLAGARDRHESSISSRSAWGRTVASRTSIAGWLS